MKITERDRQGARAKLAKAGLTPRQLNALEDMVLRDAITKAEQQATSSKGMRTHRLSGIGTLLSFAGTGHAYEAIRVATYWYHEHAGHRQELPKMFQYETVDYASAWRPEEKTS